MSPKSQKCQPSQRDSRWEYSWMHCMKKLSFYALSMVKSGPLGNGQKHLFWPKLKNYPIWSGFQSWSSLYMSFSPAVPHFWDFEGFVWHFDRTFLNDKKPQASQAVRLARPKKKTTHYSPGIWWETGLASLTAWLAWGFLSFRNVLSKSHLKCLNSLFWGLREQK